ncbi:MAG: hypothetical protein J0I00_02540 [Burkholderiales bacterium]|uniref:I78 family peptidase inhibitor n=1 Tax=Ottowia pentelensis TaxID=511108 RepID=A0ABV6PSB5_9BURK|nr:I78 family peptidase inhibitor [Ottowia sp.]MBN9404280.1 hypothetical protein [Burkholderiales bacterium]MBS0401362.1 hypothetical protein [Pseudomonadota bacterium]MBS0413732.1 hypothetical protein [Pseudomonadota bacterium]
MHWTALTAPLTLGSLLTLSACNGLSATAPAPAAAAPPPGVTQIDSGQPPRNQCRADAAQFLVGSAWGADTLAQALAAAGADRARMLRPDSMVTKEYMAGRLNVVVDAAGRVVRVNCG